MRLLTRWLDPVNNQIPLLFKQLSHGVYVIGVANAERYNAFTAAWVMQTSFDPLLLALSINPCHSSYSMLKQSGVFSVNVLETHQIDLATYFGRASTIDKLADVQWHIGRTGAPILDDSFAYFDCEYSVECAAGDHQLIVGQVVDGRLRKADGEPMKYSETGDMDGSSKIYPDHF